VNAAWQSFPFEEVISDESGGNLKTPQSEYAPTGRFPVIDQGKQFIAGYVDDESRVCRSKLPVIVFGDHTRCFKFIDFPFCMGADGVKVLRPRIEADVKYLYRCLQQVNLPSGGYDRHFKYLRRSDLLLPPLPEQRRIADVLDRAEALRAKRREVLTRLDDLTEVMFLDAFGHPVWNSKNFPLVELGSLGEWQSGGTPPRSDVRYFEGEEVWFSSGELGPMYVSESREHISKLALEKTSARRVPTGALMLGMYDTAALKASISGADCSCNQAVAFSFLDRSKVETLYAYLAIVIGREQFRRLQRGVRQKNLNLTMIRELRIPNPPIELQRIFARRVAAIEKLKSLHRASLAKLDELFASLQHRAFRGEL
jgi:type I restriction enzyme S subunit